MDSARANNAAAGEGSEERIEDYEKAVKLPLVMATKEDTEKFGDE